MDGYAEAEYRREMRELEKVRSSVDARAWNLALGVIDSRRLMRMYWQLRVRQGPKLAPTSTLSRQVLRHYCAAMEGRPDPEDRQILQSKCFLEQRWRQPFKASLKLCVEQEALVTSITSDIRVRKDRLEEVVWEPCRNQQDFLHQAMSKTGSLVAQLLGPKPHLYTMSHGEAFNDSVEHALLLVNNSQLPIYYGIDCTYSDVLAAEWQGALSAGCATHGQSCPCSPPSEARRAEALEKVSLSSALLLYSLNLQVPSILEKWLRLETIKFLLHILTKSITRTFAHLQPDATCLRCDPDEFDASFGVSMELATSALRWSCWPYLVPLRSLNWLLAWDVWPFMLQYLSPDKLLIVSYFVGRSERAAPATLARHILDSSYEHDYCAIKRGDFCAFFCSDRWLCKATGADMGVSGWDDIQTGCSCWQDPNNVQERDWLQVPAYGELRDLNKLNVQSQNRKKNVVKNQSMEIHLSFGITTRRGDVQGS